MYMRCLLCSYLLMEVAGWLVSYHPWPTKIHRGPTLFGTLGTIFSYSGWEISLSGSQGFEAQMFLRILCRASDLRDEIFGHLCFDHHTLVV